MAAGQVLLPKPVLVQELVTLNRIDARKAASEALAAYLRSVLFHRDGGEDLHVSFGLCQVLEEWPDAKEPIEYPSASIIEADATVMDPHSFTPTPIEDSLGVYDERYNVERSVLWKIAEVSKRFQVDFWTTNVGDRDAIAGQLPGLFSIGEGRSSVVLSGSDRFFCAPVRCYLEDYRRMDESGAVYENERRLMATIVCDVDVLELRCATVLAPSVLVQEVGEQVNTDGPEVERDLLIGCKE